MEAALVARGEVPATSQMSVRDAEAALWRALSECHLVATGLNEEGRPTEIPAREWLYLKLFEEDHRDALKYDALDRREPFTKIVLRRGDLLNLWPRAAAAVHSESGPIESYMLEPISRPGNAGFVPLCSALQWIMTRGGGRPVMMDDKDEWGRAVALLWPLICGGDIELIGLHRGCALTKRVPPEALTLVRPLQPLATKIGDMLLSAPSHIACTPLTRSIGGATSTTSFTKADTPARHGPIFKSENRSCWTVRPHQSQKSKRRGIAAVGSWTRYISHQLAVLGRSRRFGQKQRIDSSRSHSDNSIGLGTRRWLRPA
jgi:hypothetical protein